MPTVPPYAVIKGQQFSNPQHTELTYKLTVKDATGAAVALSTAGPAGGASTPRGTIYKLNSADRSESALALTCALSGDDILVTISPGQMDALRLGSHNILLTATDAGGNDNAVLTGSFVVTEG